MRKGFALITAIFMMVAVAVIGVAILMLSSFSVVQKSQAFMRTQSELIARSATEYAIYQVQKDENNIANNDWKNIGGLDLFDVNITVEQMKNSADTNSTFLIDVTVGSKEIDGNKDQLYPIRFTKRTVQQI